MVINVIPGDRIIFLGEMARTFSQNKHGVYLIHQVPGTFIKWIPHLWSEC